MTPGGIQSHETFGNQYLRKEKHASSGNWGASQVLHNSDQMKEMKDLKKIKERNDQIYSFQELPAECFVAQIAFTHLNTFILTTDGRVFSWGGITFCLGREFIKGNEKDIDEVEYFEGPIVKIATGRTHVLALDVKGRVYSWGKNDHGQLGHQDKQDKEFPTKIESLRNIVQIYAGDNMSFAIDKFGDTFAWGQNKHNCLLINEKDTIITNAELPIRVKFPSYFHKSQNLNIVLNNQSGVTMYQAKRPVKSVASETQQELDKIKTENYKLKILVKELEKKIAKWGGSQDQAIDEELEIKKKCSNDKVIRNLTVLIKKIESETQAANLQQKEFNKELKVLNSEIENSNKQLLELETKERENLKQHAAGGSGKDQRQSRQDFQKAGNALKSDIHKQLFAKEKERYDLQQKGNLAKQTIDEMSENMKIYSSILAERKRTLVNNYLMKNQDDLEKILETLYQHFLLVEKTSFESMGKDNLDYVGSKEILIKSNNELKRLQKELNQQKIEKDDIRYDIFKMIYEMILDNISLRLKQNNYIEGILEQTNQKMEKYVYNFQRRIQEEMKESSGTTAGGPGSNKKRQQLTKGYNEEDEEEETTTRGGEFGKRKQLRQIQFEEKPKKEKPSRMCS
eukprot:403365044